jgi:hypothetical protein
MRPFDEICGEYQFYMNERDYISENIEVNDGECCKKAKEENKQA